MTKNFIKYVLLALTATFCVSAKQAKDQEELAMARCSRDRNTQGQECYQDFGRPYHEEGRSCGEDRRDRRYGEENRREHPQTDRYASRYEESRCCSKHRSCNQHHCFPDGCGKAGYTLDSAGRRRCLPGSKQEYKINSQRNCDAKGNCQEFTKNDLGNPQDVIIKRKSAAQKVLEGY